MWWSMSLFGKYKLKDMYFLSGVEDYLTESAKKYKRNLMYTLTAVLVLSFCKYYNLVDSFTTLLGFRVNGDKGIAIEFVLFLLSIVCFYELLMLVLSKKQCDSHWFGKGMLTRKNKKEDDDSEFEGLKKQIEQIKYSFKSKDEILSEIEEVSSGVEYIIDERLDVLSCSLMTFREKMEQIGGQAINAINTGDLSPEKAKAFEENSKSQEVERFVNEYSGLLNGTSYNKESTINGIVKANEDWKLYIEKQLGANELYYKEVLKILAKSSRPTITNEIIDFWLPTLLGIFAIFVGFLNSGCFVIDFVMKANP